MKKKLLLTLVIGMLLVLHSAAAHALSIDVVPSGQAVTVGDTAFVDVVVSGLVGGPLSLGAYDLNVSFDAGIVDFSGVAFGSDVLPGGMDLTLAGGNPTLVGDLGSSVDVFEMSLDSIVDLEASQLDSFTLFTLEFITLAEGVSGLSLAINSGGLADALGGDLSGAALLGAGSIDVTAAAAPIPEPTTLLLFGTGLLGLAAYARKRRASTV